MNALKVTRTPIIFFNLTRTSLEHVQMGAIAPIDFQKYQITHVSFVKIQG